MAGAHCRRTRVCGAKRPAAHPAAPTAIHAAAAAAAARPAGVGAQHGQRGEPVRQGTRVLDGELREDAVLHVEGGEEELISLHLPVGDELVRVPARLARRLVERAARRLEL
jgi:hypothetical protein